MHFAHVNCTEQPPVLYKACGLENVYLRGGYTVREMGGETYMAVQDAEDLHRAIAEYLVLHQKNLVGREVRFLRRHLGVTQADLADCLGVSDQSIARYEKSDDPLTGPGDRLLRLLVLAKLQGGPVMVAEVIEAIRQTDSTNTESLVMERGDDGWKIAA
jgi:DNA-binding transcriptional regulator YiaG